MHEGLVLSGRFALVRKIGQGGMGAVWEGRDERLNRRVAIKTLAVSPTPDAARRLRAEAEIGANLSHPGITVVHDFGEYEQTLYVVMEYLEGHDLGEELASGALTRGRALWVAGELLGALGAAHAQGVVHRDVKPANVMLLDNGGLKILDFGISRFADATMTGSIMGTPGYMAPEQFDGRGVDHRCDLYSFGILLYEMFTGALPFRCSTLPEFMHAHLARAPEPPRGLAPDLPEALERLILDLLAKSPAARPATAEEALARLEEVRFGVRPGAVSAAPPAAPQRAFADPSHLTPPPAPRPPTAPSRPATQTPWPPAPPQSYTPPQEWFRGSQPPIAPAPRRYGYPSLPPQPGYGTAHHAPYGHAGSAFGAYAGWPVRVAGSLIELLLIGVVPLILFSVGDAIASDPGAAGAAQGVGALFTIFGLLLNLAGFGWLAYQEGTTGQSIGKRATNTRLVAEATGRPIGFGMAVVRRLAHIIDYVICYLGFLWPLWDTKRQTLADKVVSTVVVRAG
ncbi:hypothetical protein GCM10022221_21340 [Actinocorallia aurea]